MYADVLRARRPAAPGQDFEGPGDRLGRPLILIGPMTRHAKSGAANASTVGFANCAEMKLAGHHTCEQPEAAGAGRTRWFDAGGHDAGLSPFLDFEFDVARREADRR